MRVVRTPVRLLAIALLVVLAGLGACSGDTEQSAGTELSAEGRRGQELAQQNGCTSCHSVDGRDGVGPSWVGLAGSEVELDDGTVVTADEEYLTTAIIDPNAQIVEGFRGIMPERNLDPDDVAAIVVYLREIGSDPAD